jgi:hypothetical protein
VGHGPLNAAAHRLPGSEGEGVRIAVGGKVGEARLRWDARRLPRDVPVEPSKYGESKLEVNYDIALDELRSLIDELGRPCGAPLRGAPIRQSSPVAHLRLCHS